MRTPWFARGRRRYVAAILLVADLSVGCWSAAMAANSAPGGGISSAAASALTVDWTASRAATDPTYPDSTDKNQPLYAGLRVTVSQTKDLTDQGLVVSWDHARATPGSGAPSDYMQVMQCWGSPGASGPTPQQCQWGTPNATLQTQTGLNASSRDLMTGSFSDQRQFPDGNCATQYVETPFNQQPTCSVPFWSVTDPLRSSLGWVDDPNRQPPFNPAQSNEVTYGRTASDGTGQYIFNLQSALTAPYLGCGNAQLMANGHTCWLVVVPRGEYDPNGDLASAQRSGSGYDPNFNYLAGSPLEASAWRNRIQVKLDFTPIGANCKLGAASYATAGSEFLSGAFASWQATLCSRGTTFGFSRVTDPQARQALVPGGGPVMTYMSSPLDPGQAGSTPLVYAPVADSAIVVAYTIDKSYRRFDPSNPNPDYSANGTLVQDLRLTPLIVAKLLTQSYRSDTPGDGHGKGATVPATNPYSLLQDQDFLTLNPHFRFFNASQIPDGLIVPFGNSDAAHQVWTWLRSDSAARRFLSGQTVDGASINSAYTDLHLATDTSVNLFPKNDQSTFLGPDWPKPGYGTLDMRPYAASFADSALKVVAANSGKKTTYDPLSVPPQPVSSGAQTPGTRFTIALTTSSAAALYGLPTAGLVPDVSDTSAGAHATSQAISAEIAGASVPTSVAGVEAVDPSIPVSGGYPLALRTYAGVNVCATALTALTADAQFLTYVAGAGQAPGTQLGQLPPGYAPLAPADKSLAKSAAVALRAEVSSPKCSQHKVVNPTPTPTPTPSGTGSGSGSGSGSGVGSTSGGSIPTGGTTPSAGNGAVPAGTKTTVAGDAIPGGITPTASIATAGQYGLLAALCFFAPCAVVGPTLLRASRNRA